MQLEGKVALITGADSGIGQATAAAFAQVGASVCITYHTDADGAAETKGLVEAAGGRALVVRCDVGEPESVEAAFDRAAAELGVPDLLMANAGVGMGGMPVAEMDDAKLMQVLRTDLLGAGPLRPHLRALAQVGGRQGTAHLHRLGRRAPAGTGECSLWHGQGRGELPGAQPVARGGG